MKTEEWRDIKGYENIYKISNLGRIKSLSRDINIVSKVGTTYTRKLKDRFIRIHPNSKGYLQVRLHTEKVRSCRSIHRLIAIAFIPNPKNLPCVNHINGDKLDNRIENLEWCTHLENMRHAQAIGLIPPLKGKHNGRARSVINCRGEIFDTMKEACLQFGLKSPASICQVLDGRAKTAGKYSDTGSRVSWRYFASTLGDL